MTSSIVIHFDPLLNRLEGNLQESHTLLEEATALTEGLLLADLHEAVHLPAYISALRRVLLLATHSWEQSLERFMTLQDESQQVAGGEASSFTSHG